MQMIMMVVRSLRYCIKIQVVLERVAISAFTT